MVDNYELGNLIYEQWPVRKPEWEKLETFVRKLIKKQVSRVVFKMLANWDLKLNCNFSTFFFGFKGYDVDSEKTADRIHLNSVTHDLFYRCLEEDMVFRPIKEVGCRIDYDSLRIIIIFQLLIYPSAVRSHSTPIHNNT